jgi:medium-chain acyl-[acyl-carrier-protein] hydrolase
MPDDFERWFLRPVPRPDSALRLICVPYAGGGVTAFHGWAEKLPGYIEAWLLRLPGRETRLRERPYTDLPALVRAAAPVCADRLDRPFALFGHSLGAIVAFELARQMRRDHARIPLHLAVSARPAPYLSVHHRAVHQLPDDEFLTVLDQRFKAIPPVIRDDPEMRALYLPILRADMTMLETYRYREEAPLECSVSAFGGAQDAEAGFEELMSWRSLCRGPFTATTFPGGHFFIQPQRDAVLLALARELSQVLIPGPTPT